MPLVLEPLFDPVAGEGHFFGFLGAALWSGIIAASLARDIMIKPVVFCLPGHDRISGRVLLFIGVVVSAVLSLTFLAYPVETTAGLLVAVESAFALGLAAYLSGVLLMIPANNSGIVPGIIFSIFTVSYHDLFAGLRVFVETTTVDHPLATSALSILILFVFWRITASRRLARRLCGSLYLPVHGLLNASRVAAFHNRIKLERLKRRSGRLAQALQGLFHARMERCSARSGGRYFWGTCYTVAGNALPVTRSGFIWVISFTLLLTAILGYVVPHIHSREISTANIILFLPFIIACAYPYLNLYTTLLIPAGRKERFRTHILASLALCLLAMIAGVLIFSFSWVMKGIAPEISLSGKTLVYFPVNLKVLFFFTFLAPFLLACHVLFTRWCSIALIILSILAFIVYCNTIEGFLQMAPLGIVVLHLVFWLPFIGLVYYCCRRKDLVLVSGG